MGEPKKPFYVSFAHDPIPRQVDHSRGRPGPGGGTANRAGFTSVTSRPRLTLAWDTGTPGRNGSIPIFVQSANIYFRLTDFVIAISSDYAPGSCAYNATLRHELEAHIRDPIRIFHSYRDVLIRRINTLTIPTREAPLYLAPGRVSDGQAEIERQIVEAIGQTRADLVRALQQARSRHDSSASYRIVHAQCTDAQWAGGN